MSEEKKATQEQAVASVPLIVQYQKQLDSFKQQKEGVKIQFHQLEGAIFACENMIKQHEENLKNAAEKFAQDVLTAAGSKLPGIDDQGAMNNDQANSEPAKHVTKK